MVEGTRGDAGAEFVDSGTDTIPGPMGSDSIVDVALGGLNQIDRYLFHRYNLEDPNVNTITITVMEKGKIEIDDEDKVKINWEELLTRLTT